MDFDSDDPMPFVPPSEAERWLAQHWAFFKMTAPTQCVWMVLYVLAFTALKLVGG